MKTYAEVTQWLFTQLPVYQNQGSIAYKPGLEKMRAFSAYLGNPPDSFPSVHVAGTNGKGSTSHMLSSALQAMGYKVGLYTSPHLLDFSERIRVNGQVAKKHFIIDFVQRHKAFFIDQKLSFFEITVGMAFAYFAQEKVDYAIIEVGLGGRLDATNIISPLLSIITNIGLDHTEFLGNSLAEIAFEKGGIIKKNIPVVVGESSDEILPVFRQLAKEKAAKLILAEASDVPDFPMDLRGNYQEKNRQTAYTALMILLGNEVPEKAICGFSKVIETTGIRGRWEEIESMPKVVVDVTHNAEGFQQLVEEWKTISYNQLHLVLGFVKGKNVKEILGLLPREANVYLCAPGIPRVMEVEEIEPIAQSLGINFTIHATSKMALIAAKEAAGKHDFIFVGGSTFVAAEILT